MTTITPVSGILNGRRAIAAAVAIFFALCSGSPADARGLRCRSDPVVVLSDGTVLDLSADIGTLPWDIESVDYVLQVPAGLRAILVVSTPSWPTTIERFTLRADGPAGVYDSWTTVRTKSSDVDVTANLLVGTVYANASGKDDQVLRVRVQQRRLFGLI